MGLSVGTILGARDRTMISYILTFKASDPSALLCLSPFDGHFFQGVYSILQEPVININLSIHRYGNCIYRG